MTWRILGVEQLEGASDSIVGQTCTPSTFKLKVDWNMWLPVRLLAIHALLVLDGTAFSAKKLLSRTPPRWSSNIYSIDHVSTLWDSYNAALESSPLVVKSLTAGVILGAADFAGQALEDRLNQDAEDKSIDFARAARFAIFGLVLQGKCKCTTTCPKDRLNQKPVAPWNHFYYLMLDGQIPPTVEPFSATNVAKVLIDQFIQAPIFTVLIFAFLGTLEGKDATTIKQQLKNDYKDTLIANWKLWVPATVINIAFVPPLLRVLYLNIVFFFWSIYLSLVLNKDETPAS